MILKQLRADLWMVKALDLGKWTTLTPEIICIPKGTIVRHIKDGFYAVDNPFEENVKAITPEHLQAIPCDALEDVTPVYRKEAEVWKICYYCTDTVGEYETEDGRCLCRKHKGCA